MRNPKTLSAPAIANIDKIAAIEVGRLLLECGRFKEDLGHQDTLLKMSTPPLFEFTPQGSIYGNKGECATELKLAVSL